MRLRSLAAEVRLRHTAESNGSLRGINREAAPSRLRGPSVRTRKHLRWLRWLSLPRARYV